MAIFFKSLKNIYASNSKRDFILSLIAVAAWLIAISIGVFSEILMLEHGNMIITIFLVVSVLFSINAIPRTPRNQQVQQPVATKEEVHEH